MHTYDFTSNKGSATIPCEVVKENDDGTKDIEYIHPIYRFHIFEPNVESSKIKELTNGQNEN